MFHMEKRVGPAWAVKWENIFKFTKNKFQQKEVDKSFLFPKPSPFKLPILQFEVLLHWSALEKYLNDAIIDDPE